MKNLFALITILFTLQVSASDLSLAEAQSAVNAAIKESKKIVTKMDIAVVDAGGIPLKKNGKVIGAFGVSGSSVENDHRLAAKGAKAAFK